MPEAQILTALGNLDTRLTRVENFLPSLATREELHEAVAPLATREEMHAAIAAAVAPLATREEMRAAISAAVAPLATREEMRGAIAAAMATTVAPLATRDELARELERSRLSTQVLIDDLKDDNRIILEHLIALSARVDALARR